MSKCSSKLSAAQQTPSPTFITAFLSSSHLLCGTASGSIQIFSLPSLTSISSLQVHSDQIFFLHASAYSNLILSASRDNSIKILKNLNLKDLETLQCGELTAVTFSAQVGLLAYAGFDKTINLKSLNSLEKNESKFVTRKKIWALRLSDDGEYMLSCGSESKFSLWRLGTNEVFELDGGGGIVKLVEFCGERIVSACSRGHLVLWDFKSRTITCQTIAGGSSVRYLAVSGSYFVTIVDTRVQQWDYTLKLKKKIECFNPTFAAMSENQQKILIIENSKVIKLFDIEKKNQERAWAMPETHELCRTETENNIITGGDDCLIRIWDKTQSRVLFVLSTHKSPILSVSYNEELLLSCSSSSEMQTVRLRNLEKSYKLTRKTRLLMAFTKKRKLA